MNLTNSTATDKSFISVKCMNALNIFGHGVGFLLLCATYKKCKSPQHILLLNLSFVELMGNILNAIRVSVHNNAMGSDKDSILFYTVLFIDVSSFTTVNYLYYTAMFLLTGDRLAKSVLLMRYNIFLHN